MKKVMTLLVSLMLAGCTRIGVKQEEPKEETIEKQVIVNCQNDKQEEILFYAKDDKVYAMQYTFYQTVQEFTSSLDIEGQLTQDELLNRINDTLSDKYKDIKGVSVIGEIEEENIKYIMMIDFDEADIDQLIEHGLINAGEVQSQYISLKETRKAYQNIGFACKEQ
ncbi:DUF1307 domain-containing protein [Floccifex sp.]|uniref:DUF1307 domain-containing protein n=1 Tax=Floccifex sp. TaxID=2815810 RepID=UPI002A750BD8|nr:DUF1307 domain-containing protein [Floccifex sp.]MDD7281403.1 DUF1307 domain-containing protein [Erysipelotrichaceae bacterium]MDY2957408.1 DUF1307 domain-containing protein [Floccifex sp.]